MARSLKDLIKTSDNEKSLTLKYSPFILRRVREKYSKHMGIYKFDALLEVALEASLKAERNYDPSRGTDFSTYARHYIDGDMDSFVSNLTKSQVEIHKRMLAFIDGYVKENEAYPSENMICKALGMSFEKYKEFLRDLEPVVTVSYHYSSEDGGREEEHGIDQETPETALISVDIMNLLKTMPKTKRDIIQMVCIDELSIHHVMNYLKCSKAKAQSAIATAINEFRAILEANDIRG